ncbi:YnfA family protein [Helicobacter sp. MIT 05-5294]|uniref:YnfA family protein n=1 Tax=Helicobacter sp. MIT 05-5294 TaxID=1548150 RepID=UPI000A6A77F7|nr:YnfA family protein [Helicobacter sp. MIT 05-5294]
MLQSLLVFVLAAFLEVGGGYLVWIWLKEEKGLMLGIIGMICLALYGVVATWQVQGFGRVYAAYGGIFIVFSIIWAMKFDSFKPDMWDIIGGILVLFGVCLIMYAPRN